MKRPVKEGVIIKLGGHIISKYHGHGDVVEVVMIIRADDNFYSVLARGRQAHRALKIRDGQVVEVQGRIIEHSIPTAARGWNVVYSMTCDKLRVGSSMETVEDPLSEHSELPKFQIFKKCSELNG